MAIRSYDTTPDIHPQKPIQGPILRLVETYVEPEVHETPPSTVYGLAGKVSLQEWERVTFLGESLGPVLRYDQRLHGVIEEIEATETPSANIKIAPAEVLGNMLVFGVTRSILSD